MNNNKKVGAGGGAGLVSAGSAASYFLHPGQVQLTLAGASAIVALLIFAADGFAWVVTRLATTAVDLWLKAFTAVNEQHARNQELAARLEHQRLNGPEPPDPG